MDLRESKSRVTEDRLQEAAGACAAAGAQLVYLFGSQAAGGGGRDIDLAVLFEADVGTVEHGRRQVRLLGQLMAVFQSNAVDLVVLNGAPPVLSYEAVIRRGRLLYARDPLSRVVFEVRAFQRYADTAALRSVQDRYMLEAIHSGAAAAGKGRHRW
jgi:predicted nucleotidyltransferase